VALGGEDSFSATLSMRLYADPMPSIQPFLGRVAAGYTCDDCAAVTISGYYVDVPSVGAYRRQECNDARKVAA